MRILQAAVVALVLVTATNVNAVVDIRLDFGNKAAAPMPNWNTLSAPTTTDIPVVDYLSGDASSGITLSFIKTGSTLSNGTTSANWNLGFPGPNWLDANKDAAKDFMSSAWNTSVVVTFKNLDPTLSYTLEGVASTSGSANTVPWRVNNNGVWSGWTNFNAKTLGYDQGQWLTWTDLTPDASNQIALQIGQSGVSTNYNILFNAVRLHAVPEPATLVLLTLGGLLVARRRSA
jgi:hypothetical protein